MRHYCVFGTVVDGMAVMNRISKVKTGAGGPFRQDVPQTEVLIVKVTVIDEPAGEEKPQQPANLTAE